jgi:hypothetical protein
MNTVDSFVKGFLEGLDWLKPEEYPGDYTLAPCTLKAIEADCNKFQEENEALLEEFYEEFSAWQAGFDFYLSRNGHGAGYFDRGNGYDALQKASRAFGPTEEYTGDDNLVYMLGREN